MKIILSLAALLLFAPSGFCAGPDRASTADSVYIDGGNTWGAREVKMSTFASVVISSAATDSGLGISSWRKRTVINGSTCAVLGIAPSGTGNTSYDQSNSVTLGSTTANSATLITAGNSLEITHQAAIEGIWKMPNSTGTPANLAAGRGAIVIEEYWK